LLRNIRQASYTSGRNVSVPECPANRVGGGEFSMIMLCVGKKWRQITYCVKKPSEMRKQALRDVKQIDGEEVSKRSGERRGD
jgi:hypothetical protein